MGLFVRKAGLVATSLLAAAAIGCASPGLPKPPSLGLPAPVKDLTAVREQDGVTLHFTEPATATDKLPLNGQITVILCREESTGPCNSVLRQTVAATRHKDIVIALRDQLPPALIAGAPALLTYRVTLLNEKGRSASASEPAYAAAGAAPVAPGGLTVAASQKGAVFHWRAESGTDTVELERKDLNPPAPKPVRDPSTPKPINPFQSTAGPVDVHLLAGGMDAGGTVDSEAEFGHRYSYTVWRVRKITLVGHALELRSAASAPVTLSMSDIFPPAVPRGLTAVPGNSGIDLSWEPDTDVDLAGYVIYRAGAGSVAAPVRLNANPSEAPAFHDATASAGHRYRYSVSAVDQSGNESQRSPEVEEGIE